MLTYIRFVLHDISVVTSAKKKVMFLPALVCLSVFYQDSVKTTLPIFPERAGGVQHRSQNRADPFNVKCKQLNNNNMCV